ncbi:MAG: DUF1152 domain-containing protein, partial [Chloroflexota bacterium]
NLPISEMLHGHKNILIAGMGGGYDVFAGLPIYFELITQGFNVHLANLSFSDIAGYTDGEQLTDTLVGIDAEVDYDFDYFPEYALAQWFMDEFNELKPIWCFHKTGARPLIKNYRKLVDELDIDAIILVDGGVDSLMRGDEPDPGTIFEDTIALIAVNELKHIKTRIVACVGMGAEFEVGYAHLFENIAALTKANAFLGACSLTKQMESYRRYEQALMFVFDQQPQFPSRINSAIISAVRGEYGNYHLLKRTQGNELRISALMGLYWFFDLRGVTQRNKLVNALSLTYTEPEAFKKMKAAQAQMANRDTPQYPLW